MQPSRGDVHADQLVFRPGVSLGLVLIAAAAVRKESPAAKASIAVDDLILSMDGKAMNDLTPARLGIAMATGHTVNLVLFHGGRKVTKRVAVPSAW